MAKGLALRKFKAHKRSSRAGEGPEAEVEYDEGGQAVRDEIETARNRGGSDENKKGSKKITTSATTTAAPRGDKKQRKVEGDDGAVSAAAGANKRQRHRPGQGKQATNDALSFVDM